MSSADTWGMYQGYVCRTTGKGVYGDVMLARTRVDDLDDDDEGDSDSLVMVKSLLSHNDAHVATCRREVELFSRVSHDHVTRLVSLCCKMEPLYLVTEYCEWVRLIYWLCCLRPLFMGVARVFVGRVKVRGFGERKHPYVVQARSPMQTGLKHCTELESLYGGLAMPQSPEAELCMLLKIHVIG